MPHPRHEQPFAHFDLARADVHHYPLITPYPVPKADAVEPAGRPQQRLMFLPTRQAADHFQLGQGARVKPPDRCVANAANGSMAGARVAGLAGSRASMATAAPATGA